MKVALVIDEVSCLDFVLRELLEDVQEHEDYLGMKAYSGISRGRRIKVYFCNSLRESVLLRTEDLFLFEDLEIIVNIGYCFCSPEQNKVQDADLVVVGSSKCDHFYRDSLNLNDDTGSKRISELDKKLEKRMLDAAEKLGMAVKSICCCSVTSLGDLECLKDVKLSCGCFDQKAFALYEMAKRYNRSAICLYRARNHELIDLHHYLIEKQRNSLNDLIQIALEFEFRCRIK